MKNSSRERILTAAPAGLHNYITVSLIKGIGRRNIDEVIRQMVKLGLDLWQIMYYGVDGWVRGIRAII